MQASTAVMRPAEKREGSSHAASTCCHISITTTCPEFLQANVCLHVTEEHGRWLGSLSMAW